MKALDAMNNKKMFRCILGRCVVTPIDHTHPDRGKFFEKHSILVMWGIKRHVGYLDTGNHKNSLNGTFWVTGWSHQMTAPTGRLREIFEFW